MENVNYFLSINSAEKEKLTKFLFNKFLEDIDFIQQKHLLKIFDEIENYEVSNGKFYLNVPDLFKNIELEEDSIFIEDPITGMYKTVIIIKKLKWSETVDHVYEIRMGSETSQHRIFIFPYDKKESKIKNPFVTITYGFDKKTMKSNSEGNQVTDSLRDSSQRIRNTFYDDDKYIKRYIPAVV